MPHIAKLAFHQEYKHSYFSHMIKSLRVSLLFSMLLLLTHCDKNETITNNPTKISGTGNYAFTDYAPFANKPTDCFYHIPTNSNSATPIFIVLPGAARDANVLRDGLIAKANQKGFIVLALEFSETNFPGSDAYNLANIFEDGDKPSASTQNPEEEWTFSVFDPIFEDFKQLIGNSSDKYDVFGHSAGAQMVHRFLIFQPTASFNRVVSSAAGWYNMPDKSIDFPYGLKKSPSENANLTSVFARRTYIIVGENDTDPNSFNLRHTPEADAQGLNRLQRAQYFYQESRAIATNLALPIDWRYNVVPNTGHDGTVLANFAADLLY